MQNFSIGLSGISAAQNALDVIANNIANAATEGYHRQRIDLTPAYAVQTGGLMLGGGVDISGISRMIDTLLEQEILNQRSSLGQISQEYVILNTVESVFGEFSSESGLNAAIDVFFNSLADLSAHPGDIIYQEAVVSAGEAMASQFRNLGEFLANLENQIQLDAENTIGTVNTLIGQIAGLNDQIERLEMTGGDANNLRDQRDQYISEMSELIAIETVTRPYGVVDVLAAGAPVVTGSHATLLEVGLNSSSEMGISVSGVSIYDTNIQGGSLGGLLSLRNTLVSDIHTSLNSLADAMIAQVNNYHVEGVGSSGSFTQLTGWTMSSTALSDFDPSVTDGTIYIRVTNTSTGAVTRGSVSVDASADTLSTIATAIDGITGVSSSVVSSKLQILADSGYEFDFMPAVLPTPTASTLTGSPPTISVAGIFTGTSNDTLTFTVSGTGSIGAGTLSLVVTDGGANTVATLDVGSGYAAGDELDLGNGVRISLTTGSLNDTETFSVDVFGDTDSSGVLAATGINTFFSGTSATNIAVCSAISTTPGRIATSLGSEKTDNANILRIAGLDEDAVSSLNSLTMGEYYRQLVTDMGQNVSLKELSHENGEALLQGLSSQQADTSGVDINNEAVQMLIFEQMFQAMAKYLNTVQNSLSSLMEIM